MQISQTSGRKYIYTSPNINKQVRLVDVSKSTLVSTEMRVTNSSSNWGVQDPWVPHLKNVSEYKSCLPRWRWWRRLWSLVPWFRGTHYLLTRRWAQCVTCQSYLIPVRALMVFFFIPLEVSSQGTSQSRPKPLLQKTHQYTIIYVTFYITIALWKTYLFSKGRCTTAHLRHVYLNHNSLALFPVFYDLYIFNQRSNNGFAYGMGMAFSH